MFRYLDEQAYRYNTRKDEAGEKLSDFDRFKMAMSQIVGKRLTWNVRATFELEDGALIYTIMAVLLISDQMDTRDF